MKLSLALLCIALGLAQAEIKFGPCPEYHSVYYFDYSAYDGRWFEMEKFPDEFEDGTYCTTTRYGQMGANGEYHVNNTAEVSGGKVVTELAVGRLTNHTGQLNITFSSGAPTIINILSTDFTQYTSEYSCQEMGDGFRDEYAWIYSRHPYLDAPLLVEARKAFENYGIDVMTMTTTPQGPWCEY